MLFGLTTNIFTPGRTVQPVQPFTIGRIFPVHLFISVLNTGGPYRWRGMYTGVPWALFPGPYRTGGTVTPYTGPRAP